MTDYYSLDNILAEEEYIPVRFRFGGVGVGLLDPSLDPREDLPEMSTLHIPLWLASGLAQKGYVQLKRLNTAQSDTLKNDLRADATTVSFLSMPYFYETTKRLNSLSETPDSDLEPGQLLLKTYVQRFKYIVDKSYLDEDITNFTITLTKSEQSLFFAGYHAIDDFDEWKKQKDRQLKPSSLLRKRKR
mmetsp:Transcript_52433/g.131846  ORF Transcript_52433/g.131846 Transcript_52433/m.131846 type:complete len:188 (+) Transcript_52433:67-630(+)